MNFLPGWSPGFIAAGALTSITQVLSAISATTTITAPSGIQAGDLIVLLDVSCGYSLPTAVVPTGFTQIININDTTDVAAVASYKIAVGTEGGTSITGMAGTTSKVMYVFRGNKAAAAATVGDVGNQWTSGNPTAQTITAASGTPPLVVFGFYSSAQSGTVNPRTFTVGGVGAKDAELQSFADGAYLDCDTWIAYKIYNLAPADAVVDMDDEGDNNFLGSCYIQLA
jgi:hypothetical protein